MRDEGDPSLNRRANPGLQSEGAVKVSMRPEVATISETPLAEAAEGAVNVSALYPLLMDARADDALGLLRP